MKIEKNIIDKWKLLLKVLSEEIPEDDRHFQRWLNEDTENRKLYLSLKEGRQNEELFDKDKVFNTISSKLSLNTGKRKPLYQKKWFKYAVSSVAVIALSIIVLNYFTFQENTTPERIDKNIFDPGSKKAYLLSMQGEKIDLSESFEVKKEDGTIISNNSEGVISFQKTAPVKKTIEHQTIYVPKSGEYELILSDGSKVFLNSESQLTFPSYFEGDTRNVELTGEAYFEVKKDEKPFIIQTPDLMIEVLGTSFNINAYQTNPYVNATLVEGSIRIHLSENQETFLLQPEHNFRLDKLSDEISVQQVNTDVYTSWVKGEFVFRNQPLSEIFVQLERWYDFRIVYESPDIGKMRFTGSVEKARPLNYLLDQIQAVTDIGYRPEGDKIILYK
ncbi:FecR protein [Proteiniphilum saccharofermentans]|uniref:FecR protein n=1 Tax=Proteiniphilum saccharofermentans TaxID=1642647 RepID=A0A1R3SYJ6_9BACT|nr:FecR domain-containing protein [Proteiniphilum saccharofermentans]SCD21266.1 FecR protein [Proteiniphilum saccharofermentans]